MSSNTAKFKINSTKDIIAMLVAAGFMFFFRFIPAPEPITPYGMAILGIFIGVVIGWCASGDQTMWATFLGLFALSITLPAGSYVAAMNFLSGYVFMLTFFSLFTVGALMGADIAEYLVYKLLTLKFLEGHPWRLMICLMFGSYYICALTNPIVVAIFLFMLYQTMFDQVGYAVGDKTPTMIIICTALEVLIVSVLYPWSAPQLMALQTLQTIGVVIGNASYLIFVLLLGHILMAAMLLLMKLMKCDVEKMASADISFLHEKYGNGMTAYQKAVLTAMLIWVVGMIAIAFYPATFPFAAIITGKVSFIGWAMLMTGIMMYIKVDDKALIEPGAMARSFPWDMLFMIGFGILIGTTLTAADTGVTVWIGNMLGPVLSGMNEIVLYVVIYLVALVLTNVLNNNAVIILLSTAVVTLASQGFITNPIVPIILVIMGGEFGFLTPAASIYGAFIHSQKHVTAASAYKYGGIMFAFLVLFGLLVIIPLGALFF